MKWGRVIGFDDGYFQRGRDPCAPLVGTVMKGPVVESFRLGAISVDGDDAEEAFLSLLPDPEQFTAIFLYGNIFGGTNVVDPRRLHELTGLPVVSVVEDPPRMDLIERSFRDRERHAAFKKLLRIPLPEPLQTRRGILHVSFAGLSRGEAKRLIELYQMSSKVPEPLRLSHLIGREVGRWSRNC
ncbi:MAG: DUF99 family protein [Candidatus Diapherotrites archaeon]|nr:DUF99 family protein [Candidatus Diapherotrites archaeon]